MITVELVHSPAPRQVHELSLQVPEGTCLQQALALAGWLDRFQDIDRLSLVVGIWGRKADRATVLREGDRVEVYRPLLVDPKVARRERFQQQGAGAAGLFARRRSGAKPGY